MTSSDTLVKIRNQLDGHHVTSDDIKEAISQFPKNKVLLLGDFILDLYTDCTALGKTSKTPTLSVKKGDTEYFWGGSGLFATNLLGLGAKVKYITICGEDWGKDYINKTCDANLELYLFVDENRPTTLKERFWVDGYKLLQVDTVENEYISYEIRKKVQKKISDLIDNSGFVLLSDPRHGMMAPELISFIKAICKEKKKPLIVDTQVSSRSGNLEEYIGVDFVSVNETEARYFLRDERSEIEVILEKLKENIQVERLIMKLGMKGLIGYDNNRFFEFPAIPVNAIDPIGSGDAFLSAAALTLNPEVKMMASIFIATCAASLSTTKMGTVPNKSEELKSFIDGILKQLLEV